MTMVKSLNHAPSVPGERFFSLPMIFLNIHFQRVLMFKLITAWTTLELDLSMVSLKTWDGLSIQRFRWRSLRRYSTYVAHHFFVVSLTCNENLHLISVCSVQEIVSIGGYNPSTGDIICMGPSRDLCPTLPDGTRVVLNFSGRGDKDVQTSIKYLEV